METSSTKSSKSDTKLKQTLRKHGFNHREKIFDTLQGTIWRARCKHSKQHVVIKATNKNLHSKSIVVLNGIKHMVLENIISESKIQKYLTSDSHCPKSIVKYIQTFENQTNFFLIMEDGGKCLFDFIVKLHHYTAKGTILITELQRVIKIIFKQMIQCIEYIHNKNVCHFDISLENFLIND
eukprot:88715_1